MPGPETSGSYFCFDFDDNSRMKINWNLSGVASRSGLTIPTVNQNEVLALATAIDTVANSGYISSTINLSTGQATAERKHTEFGYIDAFFAQKDANGNFTQIYVTNNDRQILSIVDVATDIVTEMSYPNWLNGKIPNTINGTLDLKYIRIVGNTVWAGGSVSSQFDGGGRAVLVSWPVGEDPNTNPSVLKYYRLYIPPEENQQYDTITSGVTAQPGRVWGNYNGHYGFLLDAYGLGEVFFETAPDGRPLPNPTIVYLGKGQGEEQPTPTPTPTPNLPYRVYIPALFKNWVTSSWRAIRKPFDRFRARSR